MREARLDVRYPGATPKSPSPLAGEGKGEGALQDGARRRPQSEILSRPLIRPAAGAAGHLLPQAGEGRERFVCASGLPSAFFWINLAQRRDRLS